jgi:hypothetical protein
MSAPFKTTIADGIAELVIDQPPVNALNDAGWHALASEIERLGKEPDARVIVIRSEGRGFCAGVDIKELNAHPEKIVSVNAGNYRTFEAIHRNPLPVIVAVHGFVLGGGIGITGAADIVVAADDATFGVPEVDRGAMGGRRGLPAGRRRARGAAGRASRGGADHRPQDRGKEHGDDPAGQGIAQRHRGRQPRSEVPLGAGLHPAGLHREGFRRDAKGVRRET